MVPPEIERNVLYSRDCSSVYKTNIRCALLCLLYFAYYISYTADLPRNQRYVTTYFPPHYHTNSSYPRSSHPLSFFLPSRRSTPLSQHGVVGGGGSSVGRAGSPLGFGGCDDNSDCHCVVIWVVMVLGVVVRREVARGTLDIGGRWSPVRGLLFG